MTKEKNRADGEKDLLETISNRYKVDYGNEYYEYHNTKLAGKIISSECRGANVLEIGCATGVMTELLVDESASVTVVEPSTNFCRILEERISQRVTVHNCFLEEFAEEGKFDILIMASLLHHLENPAGFLETAKRFIADGGFVLATVPNIRSLHRQIGVKAGMLEDVFKDSERNIKFHQQMKFDKEILRSLFEECGYEVMDIYGYMLKPFSSEQMMKLELNEKIIDALFELGKENEELSSQLFIKARPKK